MIAIPIGTRYSAIRVIATDYNKRGECGKTKWHVPNLHELLTLANYDYKTLPPYLNSVGFSLPQVNYASAVIISDTMDLSVNASINILLNIMGILPVGNGTGSFDGLNFDWTISNNNQFYLLVSD